MGKLGNNQSGLTLIEVLLAILILGFIASTFVLLSGNIVKTNMVSNKESQSMAFATIISELVKNEYNTNPSSLKNGSTVSLESTVIDESSTPRSNPDYSIKQEIFIPKQNESTRFEGIKYMSGKETGYQYRITNILKYEQNASNGAPGAKGKYIEIIVTVKNKEIGDEETIIFRHNFDNL